MMMARAAVAKSTPTIRTVIGEMSPKNSLATCVVEPTKLEGRTIIESIKW